MERPAKMELMKLYRILGCAPLSIFWLVLIESSSGVQPGDDYLQAALQVHRWLESIQKTDERGHCYWPNTPADGDTTSVDLYHGDLGVIRFYRSLYEVTGDKAHLASANSAMQRIVRLFEQGQIRQPGLYTGIAGVGWELLELKRVTNDQYFTRQANACMQELKRRASDDPENSRLVDSTDVISGYAGIGLFLLKLYRETEENDALELAVALGDRMIADGMKSKSNGKNLLHWKINDRSTREYPNYSHGTAGNADFLVRLHMACAATEATAQIRDRDRFLAAAESGARYLRSIARIENNTCRIFHNSENGRELYYFGWCHGPAGTGRTFWHLFEATGDEAYQRLAIQSAQAIIRAQLINQQQSGFWNNAGQCCGLAGVAEFLAMTHEYTGDQELLEECRRLTAGILQKAERVDLGNGQQGLRWTDAEHRVRPDLLKAQSGYMQGAAGIGCWMLRLHQLEKSRN